MQIFIYMCSMYVSTCMSWPLSLQTRRLFVAINNYIQLIYRKMKCSVSQCGNRVQFRFPKAEKLKRKWLEVIKRPDFKPTKNNGLCINHFEKKYVMTESMRGYKLECMRLQHGTVPSIFSWEKENNLINNLKDDKVDADSNVQGDCITENLEIDNDHDNVQVNDLIVSDESLQEEINNEMFDKKESESVIDQELIYDVHEEVIDDIHQNESFVISEGKNEIEKQEQISEVQIPETRYSVEQFKNNPQSLLHFTGLENYDKFLTVLYSLGPEVYHLNYLREQVGRISVPNQLFLVLWKLRRNCGDIELAEHFCIPKIAVGNIFVTWITFMAKQWSLIDIWPTRQLVNYFMPQTFKQNYPATRIIIDGTEIHTDKLRNPRYQQASFSTYKNGNTMKTLVGSTPGGLISYCSPAYGGSTSDRQIVERSDLMLKCEKGDTILADRGFTVQDIFAPYDVAVLTPTFTKGTGHLPHKTVIKDRKLSKHRVHIERIIGLMKSYKMISAKLNHYYVPYSTDIVKVCAMLCNFKENIMK